MGAKTGKRLLALIALLVILGIGAFFTRKYQVSRMAGSMADRAEQAAQSGDYAKAVDLYRQHLLVVPDDIDVSIKYADSLLKLDNSVANQRDAVSIYASVVNKRPAQDDLRRKIAKIAVGLGDFGFAQTHLGILLERKRTPDDDESKGKPEDVGELEYMMGVCREASENYQAAEASYRAAMEHDPKRIESYSRLAALLRDRLNRPKEADQVIDSMVKNNPDSYQALLARGRYRRPFDLAGADADFQMALRQKRDDAEIYVELARSAQQKKKYAEARRILEDGLKNSTDPLGLYRALVGLGQVSGQIDQAIVDCRRGITAFPNQNELRVALAEMFIMKGDMDGLLEQIEELKRRNVLPALTDYLNANYYIMDRKWDKARQLLGRIQGDLDRFPSLKVRANELLAVCYRELGDSESQEAALRRAVAVDPNNITTRRELVQKLVDRGDIGQAIDEYKNILAKEPRVWSSLARLMIYRAAYAPKNEQNWAEIEALIADAERADPNSADPSLTRAEMLVVQGQVRDAQAVLDRARKRFPQSIASWTSLIGLTAFQLDDPDQGLRLLDQAGKELGDRVELRVEKARILAKKGKQGSEALGKAIEALSDNDGAFSAAERRRLEEGLASEAIRGKCTDVAVRLLSRCVKDDPSNLMIRSKLLSLAFQREDEAEIKRQIEAVEGIEGGDHLMGTYARFWYAAWRAERPDLTAEEARRRRSEARTILDGLASRRPDWAAVPMAYAMLEEQELAEEKDETKRRGLQESLANHYVQAISGGQSGDLVRVKRAIELLFALDRPDTIDRILGKLSRASIEMLAPELKLMASAASEKQDFEGAIEIARKSVAAKPLDYRERVWLANILGLSGRFSDGEAELREAIRLTPGRSEPWVFLVQFLVRSNQIEKAEAALLEAKAALPKDQIALLMGQGQDSLAQAYRVKGNADEAKLRSEDAKKWYLIAESEHPDDPKVRRLMAEFLLKNDQIAELQTRLRALLKNPGRQEASEIAWARRTLAMIMLTAGDKAQARQALDLFKDRRKTLQNPEDRQVLIQVLLAQKDKGHTAEAIAESLILIEKQEAKAKAEGRMLLAQIYRQEGEWSKAQEQYRAVLETQPEHKVCLTRYASQLIARIGPGSKEGVAEAEKLIAKLKQIDPNWMNTPTLSLQAELYKATGQAEQMIALLKQAADRPNAHLGNLGLLSEKLGQLDLAEQFFRRWEVQAKEKSPRAVLDVAAFLGRNGRIKEALDICEKSQANGLDPDDVARTAVGALFNDKNDQQAPDAGRAARVADLIERGMQAKPQSATLAVALGNVRERQEQYEAAIDLYRRSIELGSKDGVPLNNLAWLTALQKRQGKTALEFINRAITINGPIPDFLDTRGVVYLIAGESQLAKEDLEKAVEADPSSPSKRVHLAQAFLKLGDKTRAKQNLELAKTKGLEIKSLHPLEVTDFRQLVADLNQQQ